MNYSMHTENTYCEQLNGRSACLPKLAMPLMVAQEGPEDNNVAVRAARIGAVVLQNMRARRARALQASSPEPETFRLNM